MARSSFIMSHILGPRLTTLHRIFSSTRSLTSDALVEIKPGEIGIVSDIPEEHLKRRVIIYSPARTASQQGSGKVGKWKIDFMSTQKWENPLMGWTSTGDPYANVGEAGLTFDSEEAAKSFAEKLGWRYVVKKRHTPLLRKVGKVERQRKEEKKDTGQQRCRRDDRSMNCLSSFRYF